MIFLNATYKVADSMTWWMRCKKKKEVITMAKKTKKPVKKDGKPKGKPKPC